MFSPPVKPRTLSGSKTRMPAIVWDDLERYHSSSTPGFSATFSHTADMLNFLSLSITFAFNPVTYAFLASAVVTPIVQLSLLGTIIYCNGLDTRGMLQTNLAG